jgi:hypothetical protein
MLAGISRKVVSRPCGMGVAWRTMRPRRYKPQWDVRRPGTAAPRPGLLVRSPRAEPGASPAAFRRRPSSPPTRPAAPMVQRSVTLRTGSAGAPIRGGCREKAARHGCAVGLHTGRRHVPARLRSDTATDAVGRFGRSCRLELSTPPGVCPTASAHCDSAVVDHGCTGERAGRGTIVASISALRVGDACPPAAAVRYRRRCERC